MLAEQDALKMYQDWLYTKGFIGSTVPTYVSALRLIFRHLGDEVNQETVDQTFTALRSSSRYSACKRAWELFREYAKTKDFHLPDGPVDGRKAIVQRREVDSPVLPTNVLKIIRFLKKQLHLTSTDITQMYWADAKMDEDGRVTFPHPNGKPNCFIEVDQELIAPLREYARPGTSTPLVPFTPGNSVPFPLELVLSGR